MTKPDCGLKSGQLRVKYDLKRGVSVKMRKPVQMLVKAFQQRMACWRTRTRDDSPNEVFEGIEEKE